MYLVMTPNPLLVFSAPHFTSPRKKLQRAYKSSCDKINIELGPSGSTESSRNSRSRSVPGGTEQIHPKGGQRFFEDSEKAGERKKNTQHV